MTLNLLFSTIVISELILDKVSKVDKSLCKILLFFSPGLVYFSLIICQTRLSLLIAHRPIDIYGFGFFCTQNKIA